MIKKNTKKLQKKKQQLEHFKRRIRGTPEVSLHSPNLHILTQSFTLTQTPFFTYKLFQPTSPYFYFTNSFLIPKLFKLPVFLSLNQSNKELEAFSL